jgi:hypothetical protein
VRIQKIGPALDRPGDVTFPTHLGEPVSAAAFSHRDRHGYPVGKNDNRWRIVHPCPAFCRYYARVA